MTGSQMDDIDRIIEMAREFHRLGWMWGTSGNLSVKLAAEPLAIAITGSGASKGNLTRRDIVIVPEKARDPRDDPSSGTPQDDSDRTHQDDQHKARPSAETAIHMAVYQQVPEAGAVLHVHTVASTVLSMSAMNALPKGRTSDWIDVSGLEMLKGLGVAWKEGQLAASIPVLANQESMERLASDVSNVLAKERSIPAILVAGHGMTVWGANLSDAQDKLEALEFICQVLVQQKL